MSLVGSTPMRSRQTPTYHFAYHLLPLIHVLTLQPSRPFMFMVGAFTGSPLL